MACKNPMWRIPWDKCGVLCPPEMEKRVHNGGIRINREEYEYYKKVHPLIAQYIQENPCGQCIECRLAKSRDWANRCMLEAEQYEDNVFVTLTYDDEHLKFAEFIDVDKESGEVKRDLRPTLYKRDLQLFWKRLRKHFKSKFQHAGIKYLACGEYGDQSQRPHYHAIIFNCTFPDLKKYGESDAATGKPYFTSQILNDLWQNGMCTVAEVNWETCAYVARYTTKKRTGKEATLSRELCKTSNGVQNALPTAKRPFYVTSQNLSFARKNPPLQEPFLIAGLR